MAARRPRSAAFHVPFGIGTDTGGSIRQPAALSGIVGLKPTYGRVSRYGIVAFASSLDQIGPFARDARDAAALLHAVAGRDARDSTSAPVPVPDHLLHLPSSDDEAAGWLKGNRLGLPREYFVKGMEPGVEARIREAVADLERAGATIEEVSLPHTDYGLATYYIVVPAEASASARYDGGATAIRPPAGADFIADHLATRGRASGRRSSADHARDVRAVGGLLRRVLPERRRSTLIKRTRRGLRVRAGIDARWLRRRALGCIPGARARPIPSRDVPCPTRAPWPANMAGRRFRSGAAPDGRPLAQFIGLPWSEFRFSLRFAAPRGDHGGRAMALARASRPARAADDLAGQRSPPSAPRRSRSPNERRRDARPARARGRGPDGRGNPGIRGRLEHDRPDRPESEPPPVLEALVDRCRRQDRAEGYPGRRYHRGTEFADAMEQLAIDRAMALFGAGHANVQPDSG